MDLLHVLCRLVALEPRQADLLTRICDGPLLPPEERDRMCFDFERKLKRLDPATRATRASVIGHAPAPCALRLNYARAHLA
jgi:hypothetical protein